MGCRKTCTRTRLDCGAMDYPHQCPLGGGSCTVHNMLTCAIIINDVIKPIKTGTPCEWDSCYYYTQSVVDRSRVCSIWGDCLRGSIRRSSIGCRVPHPLLQCNREPSKSTLRQILVVAVNIVDFVYNRTPPSHGNGQQYHTLSIII